MFKQTLIQNLWSNNIATGQLLGLCPLLAVSDSVQHASGLAIASALVLIGSAGLISAIRRFISESVRLPMFVLVIATFTTVATLLMEAFAWTLYHQIALYMQIIVTNCMILGRINQVACRTTVGVALWDAVTTSIAFGAVLLSLAALREFVSLAFPLAAYPAGAFLIFGMLLALLQLFQRKEPTLLTQGSTNGTTTR